MHTTAAVEQRQAGFVQRHPTTTYFLFAFAGTWITFLPVVLSRAFGLFSIPDELVIILFILSTLTGPFAAAFLTTALVEGRPSVRVLFRRIVQWKVKIKWYLLLLLGYPLFTLAGIAVLPGGGSGLDTSNLFSLFLTFYLPNVLAGIFMPGIGEETGWRGFALPRLQRGYGPLVGTLILGSLHALWHLPVYMVPGLMTPGPFDLVNFISNSCAIIAATFVWTWFFNKANMSIFFAILVHATSNASVAYAVRLFQVLPTNPWLLAILFGGLAGLLILATRGRLGYPVKLPGE